MLVRRTGMTRALAAALVLMTPAGMLVADDAGQAEIPAGKAAVIRVEDAEDAAANATDRWKLIRPIYGSNPSVAYVYDEGRKSRVVEFKSAGVLSTPYIKDVWFEELTQQKYGFKRDDLLAKLRKEGLIEKDGQGKKIGRQKNELVRPFVPVFQKGKVGGGNQDVKHAVDARPGGNAQTQAAAQQQQVIG